MTITLTYSRTQTGTIDINVPDDVGDKVAYAENRVAEEGWDSLDWDNGNTMLVDSY